MSRMYGLIGRSLDHSFSADYFNAKFLREGTDASYRLFPIPDIAMLAELIAEYPELTGINVTIPYKEAVIPLLDALSEEARAVGAVNVVRVERLSGNVILKGYNTDITGFRDSLMDMLGGDIPERALVTGTGGAARAVGYVLLREGITPCFVSRRADLMRKSGFMGCRVIAYSDIGCDVMTDHRLVVNTTPLGTFPHTEECVDIPFEYIGKSHYLYDLVYNPSETLFLKRGKLAGAHTQNGMNMLEIQAEAAYRIWNEQSDYLYSSCSDRGNRHG